MSAPTRDRAPEGAPPHAGHALFVTPTRRGDGFHASIRGNVLELPDPEGGLGPTPEELFVVSVASDLAWSARAFLRDRELAGDVSVSASWRTPEHAAGPVAISLTVAVSLTRETTADALMAALEERIASRSLGGTLRVELVSGAV